MSLGAGLVLFLAGVAAGFVNTVAGGGSAITIPILVEMVGATVANGTNRVAILLANVVASLNFARGGAVPWRVVRVLVLPATLGAAGGAWVATQIEADVMRRVFAVVILFVAVSVVLRPSRWVEERQAVLRQPWTTVAFIAIGFYGGFVQAGVGFLLLAGLVLGGGLDLVTGNAAKVVIIAVYSTVALTIFAGASQVDVALGLTLAAGNSTGAFISSRLAMRRGAGWVRWILVVAAVAAAVRMLFF